MDKYLAQFKHKISTKKIKTAVVGLGYVGLPLALAFAKKGVKVIGIEIDKDRLTKIRSRKSYITDISDKELCAGLDSGRFSASGTFDCLAETEVIIICVPTPLKRKFYPNITYIKEAVKSIAKKIKKGSLVILESTTYPGTTNEVILPLLEDAGLVHNRDFYLCFSPERIDPGNERYPVEKIPKIVGGISPEAASLAALVYKNIIEEVVPVTSARAAEFAKLLENTFRLVNIALIDELTMMAKKMGIAIWEVIDAAKTKPFGFMPFYPGPGVGGHCIPKDPLYLYWKARNSGFVSRFIKLASDVIAFMPEYVVGRAEEELEARGIRLSKSKVLVIGVTYKKDVLDLRQSPSLDIIEVLRQKGCAVSYHDPLVPFLKVERIDLKSVPLKKDILSGFDCVIIAADHSSLDYNLILKNSRLIFDTRRVYKGRNDLKVALL